MLNSKIMSALTSHKNNNKKPVTTFQKVYEDFIRVARIKESDEYYYGRLYSTNKAPRRDPMRGIR